MIEKQILAQKLKEKQIEEFVFTFLGRLSCSHIKMQRTPLGEKITVHTSRPGLIVGKRGANIKTLTNTLKTRFNLENPQIEVEEVTNPRLDAASVARELMNGFQRFGPKRFKAMAYKALEESMRAGAQGIEIVISGRGVPGERAKTWRFSTGYLKKSGDIGANHMDKVSEGCNIKSGTVGIKVKILPPDVKLPDDITLKETKKEEVPETAKQEIPETVKEEVPETAKQEIPETPKEHEESNERPQSNE